MGEPCTGGAQRQSAQELDPVNEDGLASVVDFQDSGDLVEDLRHHMRNVTQLLASTQIGPVIQGTVTR